MGSYKKLDCGPLIWLRSFGKDPALKEAVEQLARGDVREAIGNLNSQGRVLEIENRHERIGEIAREYLASCRTALRRTLRFVIRKGSALRSDR